MTKGYCRSKKIYFTLLSPHELNIFTYFHRTSEGLRNRLVAGEQKKAHYVEMILTGWDHAIYNEKTVGTKQIALYREALVSTNSLFFPSVKISMNPLNKKLLKQE